MTDASHDALRIPLLFRLALDRLCADISDGAMELTPASSQLRAAVERCALVGRLFMSSRDMLCGMRAALRAPLEHALACAEERGRLLNEMLMWASQRHASPL